MNILHIANIKENLLNGVNVVVPQHIISQANFTKVFFLNVSKQKIKCLEKYQVFIIDTLKKILVEKKIELVIFHEVYIKEYITLSNEIRKMKIPYIIVPHSQLTIEALKSKKIKKIIANMCFFNSYLNGAKSIQCLSEYEMNNTKFKNKFIGTNGIKIPLKKKKSFNMNGIEFIYIGRLEIHQKGIDLLLGAINTLQDKIRKKRSYFKIYGPDAKGRMDAIKKMIRQYNIEDIVLIEHEIIGEEKIKELMKSDIFIQTSRFEGMPMGILEALSYGVPCLVTEETTLGSLIRKYNAGWSCKCDIKSIANTLNYVLDSYIDYKKLSNNAIRLAKDNFEWDVISKKTVEMYEKLIFQERN